MANEPKRKNNGWRIEPHWILGVGLIVLGVLLFLGSSVQAGWIWPLVLLGIGGAFIYYAFSTQEFGLYIPGGIISGLGVGVALNVFLLGSASGDLQGAAVLFSLAAGFLSIWPVARYFGEEDQWWPLIPGGIIGLVGLGVLLQGVVQGEWVFLLFMPALGIFFYALAFAQREAGFAIPGGVLTGLGIALVLITGPISDASGEVQGALVVLGLGAGFISIWPVAALLGDRGHWWALIPGGILAVVGVGLFIGQAEEAGRLVGILWPLVLIAIGIGVLFARGGRRGGRRGQNGKLKRE